MEAYEQLKDWDVYLVTSGRQEVEIPARDLELDYDEYCLLLHVSDVVLTLSKFKEGWNATAHEAMLAGTPVIGSGLGGMAELLEGGQQIICKELGALPESVAYAVAHASSLGTKGRQWAMQFTMGRFQQAWMSLIGRLGRGGV